MRPKKGWGAECQGATTQGLWSMQEDKHINCLELMAARFAIMAFAKDRRDLHIHVRSDNRATVAQINKMGGARSVDLFRETKELWSFALKRGITVTADHLPGDQNLVADRESRIFLDSSAWKLAAWVFKELEARWGPFEVDMFADRLNRQKEIFYSWKPDPLAAATDAFMMPWGTLQGYMFPPFCLIGRCLAKIKKEEAKVVVVAPTWQAQPWFPQLLTMLVEPPVLLPPVKKLSRVPKGVATSTAGDKQPHVSGVESVWQRGRQQGLSEGAATLVTKAWRTGTKCAYNTPWNKWVGWCGKRKIDPLQATVGQIANFLADRFEEGLEYATMNVYRSALSAFHPLVEGCKVGQHPTIVRLMQGTFNERPPKPRYTDTWEVGKVLDWIKSPGVNEALSDKFLTWKLAMLLALTGACKGSELKSLKVSLMQDKGTEIWFRVDALTKTKRPSKPHLTLKWVQYEEDDRLDVVKCIRVYMCNTDYVTQTVLVCH